MPQVHYLDLVFDLSNTTGNTISLEPTSSATGIVTVVTTPPTGINNIITSTASYGANTSLLLSSYSGLETMDGHMERGIWKFEYEHVSGLITNSGIITVYLEESVFSKNKVNITDYSGNLLVLDSIFNDSIASYVDCDKNELVIQDNSTYEISGVQADFGCTACAAFSHILLPPPANYTNTPTQLGQSGGVITPIYAGTYSSYIEGTANWTFNGPNVMNVIVDTGGGFPNLDIICRLSGGTQEVVDCTTVDLCDVWECIREQNTRYTNKSCSNHKLADKELEKLDRAMQLAELAEQANMCGDTSLMSTYIDEIKTITSCTNCT